MHICIPTYVHAYTHTHTHIHTAAYMERKSDRKEHPETNGQIRTNKMRHGFARTDPCRIPCRSEQAGLVFEDYMPPVDEGSCTSPTLCTKDCPDKDSSRWSNS